MTTTSDESALLRAIADNPDEDTPRLMYVDWCDENDQPERAEFIRLQIALAGPDDQLPAPRADITDRVSALWHDGVKRQFACEGVELFSHAADFRGGVTVMVARGFAETLYLSTLADLCERGLSKQCLVCGGRGSIYVAGWEDSITCDGQGRVPGDYTGKPTRLALDIMRAHPTITRVVVEDQRPTRDTARIPGRGQYFHYYRIAAEIVPRFFIDLLGENQFADEAEALDALAVAAGQWLRSHTQEESQ